MSKLVKDLLRQTPLATLYRVGQQQILYWKWIRGGKVGPPPHFVKQRTIKEYAQKFQLHTFIETGTYLGETIHAVRGIFKRIYSIELSPQLHEAAQRKFSNHKHINILHGDSSEVMGVLLPQISEPCLFWLDGHFSAGITAKGNLDTPIVKELSHIFRHPLAHKSVILIDDARHFTGEGDYPSLQSLEETVNTAGFNSFEVKDDIIRIRRT